MMMVGPMADNTSSPPEVDLRIEDDAWLGAADEKELLVLALRALSQAASATRTGRVDLLLTGDPQMQALNRDWRQKDKPTDVLSFPSDEPAFRAGFLGDISLGFGVFDQDRTNLGRDFNAHFSHLLVHGYLHLLGFDHETEDEASEMEALETKILAELGYSDPYSQPDM
tara:strand:+ start:99524 stop:100030 length:507 start_codon:yes stop_codon:yes gene_type:complete